MSFHHILLLLNLFPHLHVYFIYFNLTFITRHLFFSSLSFVLSGKMLESPNYLASVAAGELVPQLTLNRFSSPEEEWSWLERLEIIYKMVTMRAFDNNNPALWRLGPSNMEEGIYLAVTDSMVATRSIETDTNI